MSMPHLADLLRHSLSWGEFWRTWQEAVVPLPVISALTGGLALGAYIDAHTEQVYGPLACWADETGALSGSSDAEEGK